MTTIDPSDLTARALGPAPRRSRARPAPPPELPAVEPLIAAYLAAAPAPPTRADLLELRRAYDVAERMHRGQDRKSGAPYITHPLAVATILASMGMDTTTLVAALLHDTVEDTAYTLGQVRSDFGDEVAVLVDGVTKLDGERWGDQAEAETFRKIVLATAADLRVLVIKLVDRLHNLRTLGFKEGPKQQRIARASLDLLVPFAERLGIYVLKREMDDLAFATMDPVAYRRTAEATRAALARASELDPALEAVRGSLAVQRIRGDVSLRPRHLYNIHRGHGEDLRLRPCDVTRLMVLVDGPDQDCYVALGAVHAALHPIAGRVRDFIAMPKFNFYQSLHTRVIGPSGDFLEVIIRSRAMHPVAEYGIVAHIRTAASQAATADAVAGRRDLGWLQRLLAWEPDAPSAQFLDGLRTDLSTATNLVAFTPSGDVVSLPLGATALDFAYGLGPDTGDHTIGAVINGRLAPLSAELRSGYVVEVLTAPDAAPTADWLDIATAARTRVHIQRRLTARQADEAAAAGRGDLVRALSDRRVDLLAAETAGESLAIARALGFAEIDQMYAALAGGGITLEDLVARFCRP